MFASNINIFLPISIPNLVMDIFNSENRGKDDAIKKPLNYPDPNLKEEKLKAEH